MARRLGEPPRSLAPAALAYLARYNWPGNVRELSNVIERALLMSDADTLERGDFARILPGLDSDHASAAGGRALTADEKAWQTEAPSAIPYDADWPAPKELSKADINRLIEEFVASAKRIDRIESY